METVRFHKISYQEIRWNYGIFSLWFYRIFRLSVVSKSIILTVLLTTGETKCDDTYLEEAKVMAGFVYNMVVDIATERKNIFTNVLYEIENLVDQANYKADNNGTRHCAINETFR